jgi:hypothetical protein
LLEARLLLSVVRCCCVGGICTLLICFILGGTYKMSAVLACSRSEVLYVNRLPQACDCDPTLQMNS